MGALAYFKTPLGATVNSILGLSGGTANGSTVIDTTAPVITAPTASNISAVSADIRWTTDVLSSSQVEYGTSDSYGSVQPAQPADDPTAGKLGVVDHSVSLSGLQPDTTYHYKVKSKNSVGETVSNDKTFTTTAAEST
jgi:phosphodiesterase/alkaline phosphatase D-like protein